MPCGTGSASKSGFQSLLSWIGRVNSCSRRCYDDPDLLFQSLLSWIGRVNKYEVPPATDQLRVSILVVVDWSRQHYTTPATGERLLEVSILVVVDWSRQQRQTPRRPSRPGGVSILVVVDWSRQPASSRRRRSSRSRRTCFNPCCRGLVASTWWPSSETVPTASCFNPCCRGLVASTRSVRLTIDRSIRSFNPCCRGLVASTPHSRAQPGRIDGRVSILVVVDWSRQPFRTSTLSVVATKCFNPCCRGLVASTNLIGLAGMASAASFNPCCRGLVASTSGSPVLGWTGCRVFQSLLSWIGRVNSERCVGRI